MLSRLLIKKLLKSSKSILLLGPRQVGKSTLLQSLNPELTINLSDEKIFLDFKSNPNELREILQGKSNQTVVIDEIQRHPSLLNTIQVLLDSKEFKNRIRFLITGSSARKLKRGQANLLPGRILAYQLGPLSTLELGEKWNLERALQYGCLPEPYLLKDDELVEKILMTYSGVYLKEEIQAESLTRNLEGYTRFIIAAAETSGQILDFSKIAKQAKIDRKNCTRFYEILEDTLIAYRLEVFEKTNADIKKRPKFYFFDIGVLNGLLENFKVSTDRKGILFEHLVFNQIINTAKGLDQNIKMSYFRTRTGYEVDLIVEIKDRIYAIEIKSGRVDAKDVKKLEKFSEYYKGVSEFFIVTGEKTSKTIENTKICDLPYLIKTIFEIN